MFPTDRGIQPMELAREAEARGFDSIWFPEHSHIPCSRQTPWGGIEGAPPLPEEYWRTHDQFIALTAAAAVTTKLRLGTGITLPSDQAKDLCERILNAVSMEGERMQVSAVPSISLCIATSAVTALSNAEHHDSD